MNIRHAAFAAIFLPILLLAGCATTTGADQAAASFSATAGKVCAVVQPTVTAVQSQAALLDPPLSTNDQDTLTKTAVVVGTFCSTTASATSSTAQGMINAVIPVLSRIIAHSSLDASRRNALVLSLDAVQTAANILIAQAQAQAPAPVTAAQPETTSGAVPQ